VCNPRDPNNTGLHWAAIPSIRLYPIKGTLMTFKIWDSLLGPLNTEICTSLLYSTPRFFVGGIKYDREEFISVGTGHCYKATITSRTFWCKRGVNMVFSVFFGVFFSSFFFVLLAFLAPPGQPAPGAARPPLGTPLGVPHVRGLRV
jgi:hypothetical protein